MQYGAPPPTIPPPQNSHVTAVPASHWPQQPVAQLYGNHVADAECNQAPGHSGQVSEQMYKCSQLISTPISTLN